MKGTTLVKITYSLINAVHQPKRIQPPNTSTTSPHKKKHDTPHPAYLNAHSKEKNIMFKGL